MRYSDIRALGFDAIFTVPASTSAVTVVPPQTSGARIALLDISRGLFLFWMLTAHALGLAGTRESSWLAYLIPPSSAWLSERFVVLSGFTIAWVFAPRFDGTGRVTHKLRRRALQVGSIALLSNIVSRIVVDSRAGTWSMSALLDTLLLRREWSISWILLPTTLLLAHSPFLLRLARRVGPSPFLGLATAGGILAYGFAQPVLASVSSVTASAGVHLDPGRIVAIASLGVWGLAVGIWARNLEIHAFAGALSVAGALVCALGMVVDFPMFIDVVARFALFLGCGLLAAKLPLPSWFSGGLALLGRNALLVFIAHRLFMQAEWVIRSRLTAPHTGGLILTCTGAAAMFAMCAAREHHAPVSQALKRVGL